MKKIAILKLEMYQDKNGTKHARLRSDGTGKDIFMMIADYLVDTAKEQNFPYEFSLALIESMCEDFANKEKTEY